jgi:hypothetical protein
MGAFGCNVDDRGFLSMALVHLSVQIGDRQVVCNLHCNVVSGCIPPSLCLILFGFSRVLVLFIFDCGPCWGFSDLSAGGTEQCFGLVCIKEHGSNSFVLCCMRWRTRWSWRRPVSGLRH